MLTSSLARSSTTCGAYESGLKLGPQEVYRSARYRTSRAVILTLWARPNMVGVEMGYGQCCLFDGTQSTLIRQSVLKCEVHMMRFSDLSEQTYLL